MRLAATQRESRSPVRSRLIISTLEPSSRARWRIPWRPNRSPLTFSKSKPLPQLCALRGPSARRAPARLDPSAASCRCACGTLASRFLLDNAEHGAFHRGREPVERRVVNKLDLRNVRTGFVDRDTRRRPPRPVRPTPAASRPLINRRASSTAIRTSLRPRSKSPWSVFSFCTRDGGKRRGKHAPRRSSLAPSRRGFHRRTVAARALANRASDGAVLACVATRVRGGSAR